jgi:hypothetical protein
MGEHCCQFYDTEGLRSRGPQGVKIGGGHEGLGPLYGMQKDVKICTNSIKYDIILLCSCLHH